MSKEVEEANKIWKRNMQESLESRLNEELDIEHVKKLHRRIIEISKSTKPNIRELIELYSSIFGV